MLPTIIPIGALLSGIALLLLGSGLVNTVIPLRGSLEGFSTNTLGLIGSTYFLGFFLGTFVAPRLIRRMGHIRAFAFFGASVACCILLHAIVIHPWFWMGLRVLTGMGLVGFYAVIESWLNDRTAPERRGQVFAAYMIVNLAALAGAQQLLRLDTPANFTLFAIAAMFVCLSLLPVTMTRFPQPQIATRVRLRLRMTWRAAPAAYVGALSSGLSMGAFWSLTPVYGERVGLDEAGIGLLMTAAIVGGALLQWPMGRFSDAGDRRLALSVAAFGAALAAVAVALFGHLEHVPLAGLFLYGGMAFTVYPIVVAHLVDHLPQDQILAGNTTVLFLHGVGAAVGPGIAGALRAPARRAPRAAALPAGRRQREARRRLADRAGRLEGARPRPGGLLRAPGPGAGQPWRRLRCRRAPYRPGDRRRRRGALRRAPGTGAGLRLTRSPILEGRSPAGEPHVP